MLTISSATFKGIMDKEKEENLVLDYDIARMSRMRPFVKVKFTEISLKFRRKY